MPSPSSPCSSASGTVRRWRPPKSAPPTPRLRRESLHVQAHALPLLLRPADRCRDRRAARHHRRRTGAQVKALAVLATVQCTREVELSEEVKEALRGDTMT